MCANEAQVATGRPFAQVYAHAGMVGLRRREDVEVPRQPGLRLPPAQHRRRPDGDPAGPAAPPLPQRLGVGRRRALGRRRHPGPVAARVRAARRRPGGPGRRRRCSRRWPTTSTPPAPAPPSTPGSTATLGGNGMADASDPGAADTVKTLVDAALGRLSASRRSLLRLARRVGAPSSVRRSLPGAAPTRAIWRSAVG